jgi:hypothetical protein
MTTGARDDCSVFCGRCVEFEGGLSDQFVADLESYAAEQKVPLIRFEKGQRKDDVAKEHLARFKGTEGLLFFGKAQEKSRVFRTEGRRHPQTGQRFAWIVSSTAMINHYYYCYAVDEEFGPFFLKFGSYFPYNAKLCINGHEYLKRQLAKKGIGFEALDNGDCFGASEMGVRHAAHLLGWLDRSALIDPSGKIGENRNYYGDATERLIKRMRKFWTNAGRYPPTIKSFADGAGRLLPSSPHISFSRSRMTCPGLLHEWARHHPRRPGHHRRSPRPLAPFRAAPDGAPGQIR